MRGKNRKSIGERKKFPQFTTMNVIDGQAEIVKYASLNFYSLTINNILNIIVMLILVGVTITVAIQGGLFDQAKGASSDMQMEADREMLTSAVIGAVNQSGYVDFNVLDNNLPNGFTKAGDRTYKSEKGNEFTVDSETGKVEEVTNSNSGNSGSPENPENSGDTEPQEGTYSFTLGDIVTNGNVKDGIFIISGDDLLSSAAIEDLQGSITLNSNDTSEDDVYNFNNVVCSNTSLTNVSDHDFQEDNNIWGSNYYFLGCTENIEVIVLKVKINGTELNNSNYSDYANMTFTITK